MAVHDRNLTEQAVILALAYRAGLASRDGESFAVEPASLQSDRYRGFDLIIRRNTRWLLVDITSSRRFRGSKINRSAKFGKGGRAWVYVLKADWQSAAFDVTLDSCFQGAFGQLKDGQPIALAKACPIHGNSCGLARKLWDFSESLSRSMENCPNPRVRETLKPFLMKTDRPPFK